MTIRNTVIGLLVATTIGASCYFFDRVVRQGMLIPNLMPTVVYGGIVFLVLCVNPVLGRLKRRWALSRRDLAVICGFALVAGGVACWGLWEAVPSTIMLPHHHARTRPGWAHENVVDVAPKHMLPDASENSDVVVNGYVTGLSEGTKHISVADVPWYAWRWPLLFWIPTGLAITIAVLGLAVVVHKQWSRHELLPYPISVFAHSLLPAEGKLWGSVFRNRLFWLGASVIFFVHMNNYLCGWLPRNLVPIPTRLDFTSLMPLFPTLVRGYGGALFGPMIFFTVVGLAYFLASDVSFSMGVMPIVFCYAYGLLATYGVVLRSGDLMSQTIETYMFTGGYTAVFLMALYGGRHYYLQVLRRSVGLTASAEADESAAWGMRVFLVGTLLFMVLLVAGGLEWQLAVLFTAMAVMLFVVVSRAVAESGAIEIGTQVFPAAVLWTLFGSVALGPRMFVILSLASTVILACPGWAPMPFAVQALKLADVSSVRVGRLAKWAMVAVVLCTLVCIPVTIYWQYDSGATAGQPTWGWYLRLSRFTFDNAVRMKQQLEGQGSTELAESLSGWSRFAHMRPNWPCVMGFFAILGLALLFGFLRLKSPRWPLHPIVFVFLAGAQSRRFYLSFLLGWLIKVGVSKYGGPRLYNSLKPLMIGIIAGDLLAKLIPMIVGLLYFAVTGENPPVAGIRGGASG